MDRKKLIEKIIWDRFELLRELSEKEIVAPSVEDAILAKHCSGESIKEPEIRDVVESMFAREKHHPQR